MAKLALLGGTQIRTRRNSVAWPICDKADLDRIKDIYEMKTWIDGEQTQKFADRFAKYCNVKYCIPVANGTVSLELIMRALGIGRGDEVIMPPYTFIASISAVMYVGAKPVFADIDRGSYNISPESVLSKITDKTKAILAVHIGGRPVDMDKLEKIAKDKGIYLINDSAQAVGSTFKGVSVGKYGVAASISCQNSKNLTCGEGGIITTDSDELNEKIMLILNGGKKNNQYISLGQNSYMTEFQAGILDSQMDRLDEQVSKRMKNAATLDKLLSETSIAMPLDYDERITRNSYHLFVMRFKTDVLEYAGIDKDIIIRALTAEGVPISSGYLPLYSMRSIRESGFDIDTSPLPECEIASYKEGAWLPQTFLLNDVIDMEETAAAFEKVYDNIDELRRVQK